MTLYGVVVFWIRNFFECQETLSDSRFANVCTPTGTELAPYARKKTSLNIGT